MLGYENKGEPALNAKSLNEAMNIAKQSFTETGERIAPVYRSFRGPISEHMFSMFVKRGLLTKDGQKTEKWWEEIGM